MVQEVDTEKRDAEKVCKRLNALFGAQEIARLQVGFHYRAE
jgi:hypothetical protein